MAETTNKRRRRWRIVRRVVLLVFAVFLALVAARVIEPSLPTDLLLNAPPVAHHEELRAEAPGTLVVLQHGLWRSWGSLWRMERALAEHGYEVLNFSYPSTRGTVEEFAEHLHERLEAHIAERAAVPERICFVGHSLGGLVIRVYLELPDARPADTCVFIGTPHRGAELAIHRSRLWLYEPVMGSGAGLQLHPDAPLFEQLGAIPSRSIGVIFGARGDEEGWNDDVSGDDDGTVSAAEAQLPGQQADAIALPIGHTRLSFSSETIEQVLSFLRRGRFDRTRVR